MHTSTHITIHKNNNIMKIKITHTISIRHTHSHTHTIHPLSFSSFCFYPFFIFSIFSHLFFFSSVLDILACGL